MAQLQQFQVHQQLMLAAAAEEVGQPQLMVVLEAAGMEVLILVLEVPYMLLVMLPQVLQTLEAAAEVQEMIIALVQTAVQAL